MLINSLIVLQPVSSKLIVLISHFYAVKVVGLHFFSLTLDACVIQWTMHVYSICFRSVQHVGLLSVQFNQLVA